jgi:nitroimidazol reductase NimA-like FMN-containing flavoprotein (pyridoxamine 5'-phosphate oxidase superfamily)
VLDRNGLEMMDRDEALRLLQTARVGRVGVSTDAMPVVLPVNFVVDDERIVLSSAPGTKLYVAATGAMVAFEADDVDTDNKWGWSVCVSGPARVVTEGEEYERLRALPLETWAPPGEEAYIVIDSQVVTGRRVAEGGKQAGRG